MNRVGGGVAPLPLSHHRAYLFGTTAVSSIVGTCVISDASPRLVHFPTPWSLCRPPIRKTRGDRGTKAEGLFNQATSDRPLKASQVRVGSPFGCCLSSEGMWITRGRSSLTLEPASFVFVLSGSHVPSHWDLLSRLHNWFSFSLMGSPWSCA